MNTSLRGPACLLLLVLAGCSKEHDALSADAGPLAPTGPVYTPGLLVSDAGPAFDAGFSAPVGPFPAVDASVPSDASSVTLTDLRCRSGFECPTGLCLLVGSDGGPGGFCAGPSACKQEGDRCFSDSDCCGKPGQAVGCMGGWCGTFI